MNRWKAYLNFLGSLGAGPITLTTTLVLGFLANLTYTLVGLAQF